MNNTALQTSTFDFYGDELIALKDNSTGEIYTAINSVLKGIGFTDKNQIRKRRDKWINDIVISKGIIKFNIPTQEVVSKNGTTLFDEKETYNKNMLIEIQFRTKIQHTWATAVEMMGIYTKSNLKSSQGNEDILRFFILVSSILALKEGTPVCPNTSESADELIKEIKSLDSKHNIVSTLSRLNVAIDFDEKNENKKNNYYILILDYTRKRMRIKSFETKNIEVATEVYNQLEGELESDKNIVLVSASSFDSLRAAYPNYFTDIQEFVDMMRSLYDNLNKFIN